MLFTSLTFIFVFLPLTLVLFYISKDKFKNSILLIFSLIFYAWGEPKYILLMIISIIFNYLFAIFITKFAKWKKKILILSIIFNVLMLFSFKYLNFMVDNINNLFSLNFNIQKIVLPIGISFYTFQALSYVVDVYRGDVKVQKNIFTFATYVSLFPQLIAGPIVRYSDIEKELNNKNYLLDNIYIGIRRFIIGLSKKIIISNNVAIIADTIFNNNLALNYGWLVTIIGVVAYTLQIYFDFSGYSDMAIGLGKMFGFNFLENFDYPYSSLSITEFWRRWHMSLSSWFRDYVYIPLGGNRVKKARWIFNIFIVWLFTGLWHGASWNFVIWGIYYAIILLIEKLFLKNILNKLPKVVRWFYAFVLINIGWIIFRNEDLTQIKNILLNLVNFKDINFLHFIRENFRLVNYIPYLVLGIIFMFPVTKKIKNTSNMIKITSDFGLLALFMICIGFIVISNYNPFIYFRF